MGRSIPLRATLPLLFVFLLAGCFGGGRPVPPVEDEPLFLPDVEVDHNHKDPALHTASAGLGLVGFIDAKEVLAAEPARFSDIQFHGNISVVTVNGRTEGSGGGFLVFDISAPGQPVLLSRYRSGSEDNWYTKLSPDGQFVFLTANGGASPESAIGGIQQSIGSGAPTMAARGIHIVDINDPKAPKLVGYYPAPVRVVNLATHIGADRNLYVFASMTNDRVSRVTNTGAAHDLNYVSVLKFHPEPVRLEEIARWQPNDAAEIAEAFPHDLSVVISPVNSRALLFVAYWDAGGYIVDVTKPDEPTKVSRVRPISVTDHIHTFKPHAGLVGDRWYAVMTPETFGGEHSGIYRLLDITDAREPRMVKQWQLPPIIEANPEHLIFSPHEFSIQDGRVYASQFHGGGWILEIPSFKPLATWQASIGEPLRTNDWAVDISSAAKYAGYVWLVDMGSGIVILEELV